MVASTGLGSAGCSTTIPSAPAPTSRRALACRRSRRSRSSRWRRRPIGRRRRATRPRRRRHQLRHRSAHLDGRPLQRHQRASGRPGTTTVGPLNLSLVLDRSGSMAGDPFRNMLIAAETFVGPAARRRPRLRRRVLRRPVGGRRARRDRPQHAQPRRRRHPRAAPRRGHVPRAAACSPAWRRSSAAISRGPSTRSSCSPMASRTSASPARPSWRASPSAPRTPA